MRIRPPFFALMLLTFSCLPFVSSCNAAPKAPSVVSVDMQRLMTESEPAKQASEHLKQVRAVLQKGFEELRETYEGTPKDERETILANGLAALNRQMELETRAASQVVQNCSGRDFQVAQDQWCLTGYRAQYRHRRRYGECGLYQDHSCGGQQAKGDVCRIAQCEYRETGGKSCRKEAAGEISRKLT